MAHVHAEIMEPTGDYHHPVRKARFSITEAVLHNARPFDPGEYMFHNDAQLAHHTIVLPVGVAPFS